MEYGWDGLHIRFYASSHILPTKGETGERVETRKEGIFFIVF